MAIIEGTTRTYKLARAVYDFGTDGGAVGTITLRSAPGDMAGNAIPAGAVILGGYVDVTVAVASATGSISVGVETTTDIMGATAAPVTVGRKSVVPAFTGASTVKTTVTRSITATITTAAVTAGQFTVVLFYV